jgi:hypothetical protein
MDADSSVQHLFGEAHAHGDGVPLHHLAGVGACVVQAENVAFVVRDYFEVGFDFVVVAVFVIFIEN